MSKDVVNAEPSSRTASDALAWVALAFLVGRFLRFQWSLVGVPDEGLVHLFEDDAFYYLRIAERWAAGQGSSFDGLHDTNGYQPLWQWILVGLAWVARDRSSLLALFQYTIAALHTGIAVASFSMIRSVAGPWPGLFAAYLLLFSPRSFTLSRGMESALFGLAIIVALALWSRMLEPKEADPRTWRWAGLGALLALVSLARLDGLLLAACCGAVLVHEWLRGRLSARRVGAFAAGLAVVLIPYFVGNAIVFGSVLPVSVVMKTTGRAFQPSLLASWTRRVYQGWGLPSFLRGDSPGGDLGAGAPPVWMDGTHAVVLLGGVAVWLAIESRRVAVTRARPSRLVPFAAFLVVHWLLVASGSAAQWPSEWHFVPEYLASAWVPALALSRVPRFAECKRGRLWGWVARASIGGALIAAGTRHLPWLLRFPDPGGWVVATNATEAATWIDRALPEGSRLGSWDAGYLGWASRFAVVNLDGVVNDRAYVESYRMRGRVLDYVRTQGITHIVNQIDAVPPSDGFLFDLPLSSLEKIQEWSRASGPRVALYRVRLQSTAMNGP